MNSIDPTPEIDAASKENLTGLFVWIIVAAIAFGGLPYLYPQSST